jgi:hypothetical protein
MFRLSFKQLLHTALVLYVLTLYPVRRHIRAETPNLKYEGCDNVVSCESSRTAHGTVDECGAAVENGKSKELRENPASISL